MRTKGWEAANYIQIIDFSIKIICDIVSRKNISTCISFFIHVTVKQGLWLENISEKLLSFETSYRINNFTVTFYFNLFQLKIVRFNQQNEFFNKMNSPRFSINVTQSLRDHFPFELQIDIVADNIDTRSLQFQVPWHVRKRWESPLKFASSLVKRWNSIGLRLMTRSKVYRIFNLRINSLSSHDPPTKVATIYRSKFVTMIATWRRGNLLVSRSAMIDRIISR